MFIPARIGHDQLRIRHFHALAKDGGELARLFIEQIVFVY